MDNKEDVPEISRKRNSVFRNSLLQVINRDSLGILFSYPFYRFTSSPVRVDKYTAELHRRLLVVDMHSDPLLWNRDLNIRNNKGHVDFPKLEEGGVDIQFFGLPSGFIMPVKLFKVLARRFRWPSWAISGYYNRVTWQIQQMKKFVQDSRGKAEVVSRPQDINRLKKAHKIGIIPAIMSIPAGAIEAIKL